MTVRKAFSRGALAAALMLLAVACGTSGAEPGGASGASEAPTASAPDEQIVVTTTILGDVVSQLVGDDAEVEVLLPVGADSHGFALNASQAQSIRDADLVVANGLGLEEGMTDALEAAEEEGTPVFHAADHIETIPLDSNNDHADEEDGHDHADEEDGHDHEGDDPHFWFDASRMADVVEALGAELTERGVGDDVDWTARSTTLADELRDLDREVSDLLATIPTDQRQIVTNHEALGYFANRYDLTIVGTVLPGSSTLAEPSASDLEALVTTIAETGVTAIFTETTSSAQLAETVAAEVGRDIAVVELFTESLSDPDGPAATYQAFLRLNATRVAEALA